MTTVPDPASFRPTVLGKTGLSAGRLGLSASYRMPAAALEAAVAEGMNYLYFGTLRREGFATGLRHLRSQRDRLLLVVQSYGRFGWVVRRSLERALRSIGYDHADFLLLGMWNRPVPPRILDACRSLRERGLVRHLAVSTHHRPLVPALAKEGVFDVIHLRYNAVHRGAEHDVFPHLPPADRPGIVAFTATSWRQLLSPKRVPPGERVPTAGDCYRYVLSNPAVDVCMTGLASLEQTKEALAALQRGPMSPDELAWMRRVGDAIYGKARPPARATTP